MPAPAIGANGRYRIWRGSGEMAKPPRATAAMPPPTLVPRPPQTPDNRSDLKIQRQGRHASDPYEVVHFTNAEPLTDERIILIMSGVKRAISGLVWSYEALNNPLPAPGDINVLASWHGTPLCIIETIRTEILPFNQVTPEFAAQEAEGDLSIQHWRQIRWESFSRECAAIGKVPNLSMPILLETFEVMDWPWA